MTSLPDLRLQSKLYYYAGHVKSVYDGDTFTADLDIGLGIWRRSQTIRLWKVNTPELRGADREKGLEARDFVAALILDKAILLRTILDKRGADRTEKFGRLLGEVLLPGETGDVVNLNELLIQQGIALPMDANGTPVQPDNRSTGASWQLPVAVYCAYCGELRAVDHTTGWVAQCPNCLDEAHPWRT